MDRRQGDSQERNDESQPLLSPSGYPKSLRLLRWKHNYRPDGSGAQPQQGIIRHHRTQSDTAGDDRIQQEMVGHSRRWSDLTGYGQIQQDIVGRKGKELLEDLSTVSRKKSWMNTKDSLPRNKDLSQAKFDPSLLTETDSLTLPQKQKLFQAALQPSYHEAFSLSGDVPFTANDYDYYQYCKDQIETVLQPEHNGEGLLSSLQNIPFFKHLYNLPVGVREGYTLEDHTSMVLEQFRRYQMENWESSLLTAKEFQLMLAIHDIGKPQAVLETGKKSKQHEYNGRLIPEFVKWLGIPEQKRKLIVALTMQDHLGAFLHGASRMLLEFRKRKTAKEVAEKMSQEAENLGVGIEQYFDLITCYYRADAGSYTTDANPQAKFHLNHLFEEKTALNCTRAFSEKTQKNYAILAEEVESIASHEKQEFKEENNNKKKQLSKREVIFHSSGDDEDQPLLEAGSSRSTLSLSTLSGETPKREDLINLKKHKREAYRLLESLLDQGSGKGSLDVLKAKRDAKVSLTDNNFIERTRYPFFGEEKKQRRDQRRKEKVKVVKDFIMHYKNISTVSSALEANKIKKWIDAGKYLPQGHALTKELQAKIQTVHSSLEGLKDLFSDQDKQAHASREEEIVSFTTKAWSKLEEIKQVMEGTKLGSHGKKALEMMKKCYQDTEGTLSGVSAGSDHPHTLGALEYSLKDVSRRLYTLALNEIYKLNLAVRNKNWDASTIANIVEDQSYAEYAEQCFQKLNIQLERCFGLVKGKETPPSVLQILNPSEYRHSQQIQEANLSDDHWMPHHQEAAELPKAVLKDLIPSYDEAITIKHVIELAQAQKKFQETRDPQPVRNALEKFEPPQHLRESHREQSIKYWIKQSIAQVNDELMLNAINTVTNSEQSASEKLDQGLNRINNLNKPLDDAIIEFEIENTMVRLEKAQLRKTWSKKEWFSKLDDGQIKQILKEYCESYLKDLDDKVKKLVNEDGLDIWIRCQPEILRKILQCGRFKSQFETATSGGRLNKKRRAKSEYGRTGIPLNMPAPFRFISGYAARNPNGKAPIVKNVERYGPVAVRLKPELKEFALQMLDDSLKHSDGESFLTCRPTFFDNADRRCFPSGSLPFRYKLFFEPNPFKIQGREDLEKKIPYQEVQIVRVNKEDIQEVVFCTPMGNKKLTNLLEQHAIPYRRRVNKLFTMLVWGLLAHVQLH
jgi:DNA-binding transcriptional regulator YhcF (GntR family)